jgi:hypothetical protein
MPQTRTILLAAMWLVGTTIVANAQAQQRPGQPPIQLSAPPASWSYDPYTSGLGPCPQHAPTDLDSCREQMPPTYGQPAYRTR